MIETEITKRKKISVTYSNSLCSIRFEFTLCGHGSSCKNIKKDDFYIEKIHSFYTDEEYSDDSHWSANSLPSIKEMMDFVMWDYASSMELSEKTYLEENNKRRFNFDIIQKKLITLIFKRKSLLHYFDSQNLKESDFITNQEEEKFIRFLQGEYQNESCNGLIKYIKDFVIH